MATNNAAYRQLLWEGQYTPDGTTYVSGIDPWQSIFHFVQDNVDWSGEMGYPGAPRPETLGKNARGVRVGGGGAAATQTPTSTRSNTTTPTTMWEDFKGGVYDLLHPSQAVSDIKDIFSGSGKSDSSGKTDVKKFITSAGFMILFLVIALLLLGVATKSLVTDTVV